LIQIKNFAIFPRVRKFLPSTLHRYHHSESARVHSVPPRTRCYCRYRCSDLRQIRARNYIRLMRTRHSLNVGATEKQIKKKGKKIYARLWLIFTAVTLIKKRPEKENEREREREREREKEREKERGNTSLSATINFYERTAEFNIKLNLNLCVIIQCPFSFSPFSRVTASLFHGRSLQISPCVIIER